MYGFILELSPLIYTSVSVPVQYTSDYYSLLVYSENRERDISCFLFFFFFSVRGPLTAVASPAVKHRLWTRRPSGHGPQAQLLHGTWDPPGPGHEPVSPASAGGFEYTIFILQLFCNSK